MQGIKKASRLLITGLSLSLLLLSCHGSSRDGRSPPGVPDVFDYFDQLNEEVWHFQGSDGTPQVVDEALQFDALAGGHFWGGLYEKLDDLTFVSVAVKVDQIDEGGFFDLHLWNDARISLSEVEGRLVVTTYPEEQELSLDLGRWYTVTAELTTHTYEFRIDNQFFDSWDRNPQDNTVWFEASGVQASIDDFKAYGSLSPDEEHGDVYDEFSYLDQVLWDVDGSYFMSWGDGNLYFDTLQGMSEMSLRPALEPLTAVTVLARVEQFEENGAFGMHLWDEAWVEFIEEDGSPLIRLYGEVSLEETELTVELDRWYEIRVELVDDTYYEFSVDDEVVFSCDASSPDNSISLLSSSVAAAIDYFEAFDTL